MSTRWSMIVRGASLALAVFVVEQALAATVYVAPAPAGKTANDGLSWAAPKLTIQAGVDAAVAGGHNLVLVSNGTYTVSASTVVNTALRVEAFDPDATRTVVRRTSSSNPIFRIEHADAVVQGFTIENGNVVGGGARMTAGTLSGCLVKDGTTGQYGAGVWLNGGGTVTNCVIRNNQLSLGASSAIGGGGVYMTGGLLVDSLIEGNRVISSAILGGGVYAAGGLIDRCEIAGNYAHSSGAGVYLTGGAEMRSSLIHGNRSRLETGGVYVHNGRVENCTIVRNIAAGNNGGIYLTANGTLRNGIVVENDGASPGVLRNLSNNGGAVTYSCVQPAPAGAGNTSADPLFADPEGADFRPLTGSPAIDQGNDQVWMTAASDLDGNPRLAGTADMGAYEADASNAGPLRAGFTVDARRGTAPWQATFTASVAGANQSGLHYYWDFGNGSQDGAGLDEVSRTFAASGIYTVTLVVSNSVAEGVTVVRARYILSGPLDWYVSPEGSSTPPYASWDTALTDIQWAFAHAGSNDTIHLAGRDFPLDRTLTFTGAHVTVKGGYVAVGGAGPGARDGHRHPTRLTRTPSIDALRVMSVENASTCIFEELTITGGRSFNVNAQVPGGGLAVVDSTRLTFVRCRVWHNNGTRWGGGLYSVNSEAAFTGEISFNTVHGNGWDQILYGGGVYLSGGAWTFKDTVFGGNNTDRVRVGSGLDNNREKLHGGAFYAASGTHTVSNCAFYGNNGSRPYNSSAIIHDRQGGGIYVNGGTLAVANSTFVHNNNEGVRRNNGTLTLKNSILWDNGGNDVVGSATVSYSSIESGTFAGNNANIRADPLFERGLYLGAASLCRNAGSADAADFGLSTYTTSTNGAADTGVVDLGYHYAAGLSPEYADLYVAENGNDANSGAVLGEALRTVTRALALARDGTHIHVGPGLYNPASGEIFPLRMGRPGLHLSGAGMDHTVLDATATDQVVTIQGIPCDGRLAGVTVSGGYAVRNYGAGIGIWQSRVVLQAIRVTGNEMRRPMIGLYEGAELGGGIGSCLATVTLADSVITSNKVTVGTTFDGATYGGGIGIREGVWTVRNSVVAFNEAAGALRSYNYGGGLYIFGGSHLFVNTLVFGNKANKIGSQYMRAYEGDGAYVLNTDTVVFRNCSFAHNEGHGLNSVQGGEVNSSIFWGNSVDVLGKGPPPSSNPMQITYAIGITGTVSVAWSTSQEAHAGPGNLVADPLFAGNGDYHLRSKIGRWTPTGWVRDALHSPCIDAGDRTLSVGDEPMPNGNRINLGAYGGTAQASMSLATGTLILVR